MQYFNIMMFTIFIKKKENKKSKIKEIKYYYIFILNRHRNIYLYILHILILLLHVVGVGICYQKEDILLKSNKNYTFSIYDVMHVPTLSV